MTHRDLYGIWNCATTRYLVVPLLFAEIQGLEGVVSVSHVDDTRIVATLGAPQGNRLGELRIDTALGEGVLKPHGSYVDVPRETLHRLTDLSMTYGLIFSDGKMLNNSAYFLDDCNWKNENKRD